MSVSFFVPVRRVYDSDIPGQLEKKIANVLDFLFSSPFAKVVRVDIDIDQLRNRGNPYQYSTYRISQAPFHIPLLPQALKIAAFALLIFRFPLVGIGICLTGCLAKALYRNLREQILPPLQLHPQQVNPIVRQPASPPEPALIRHLQKWQCHVAFYYYLGGGSEPGVEGVSPQASLEEKRVTVSIGGEECEYSLKFLLQIPYFEATLRWNPGDRIVLSESFPFRHDALQQLRSVVEDKDLSAWDEALSEYFGFLCIPLEDYSAFSRYRQLQELLQKPAEEIVFEGCKKFSESPPQVKCIQWTMDIFPEWSLLGLNDENILVHLQKVIGCKNLSREKQHGLVNHIIDTYITELNYQSAQGTLAQLLLLLKKEPRIADYLTILRLPRADYSQLGSLLKQLPKLRWLQIMINEPREISLDSIPKCENIRIFSNDGYGAGDLKDKFPQCDIFEQT